MCQLIDYENIDPEISKNAAKKFSINLWYLAPETVEFSLSDGKLCWKQEEKILKIQLHQNGFSSFTNISFRLL